MSEKKKGIDYEAGHKRETRKSYQSFLEELMSDPSAEDTSGSAADTSDDASVRRSKRTPVPKRGFKLIDDYDSKEHSGKKKFKSGEEGNEQRLRGEKESDEESKRDVESEEIKVENEVKNDNKGDQISEESRGDDEAGGSGSPAPRKSGRARKAKTFEDSIMPEIKSRSKKPAELATSDLSDAESEILKKKVLAKLTANTPISVKEETIIGKDNIEYLYRNVFVTEILDSKRKRTCRLSKDSESKDETDKSAKTDVTKDNQEKDSVKDTNKDTPSTDTAKRKKSESKLKSTPDKTTSTKASPKTAQLNSSAEISEPKKRKSIEKEKEVLNDKNESKKTNELNDIKKALDLLDEPKRKRSSGDKHDLKKAIESKKSSVDLYEGDGESGKQKTSVKLEDDVQPSNIESKKEKKEVEKPHVSKLKKHDEKKTPRSEEKKKVKFAEKEEIKVFEKEVEYVERPPKRNCRGEKKTDENSAFPFNEQVIPTLADSVKSRRKEKEKKPDHVEQASPEPLDKPSTSPPIHHESKKNKRKTPKEDLVTSPIKADVKEQKSPIKSDKIKSVKEKEIEKVVVKESKKIKAPEISGKVEERDLSPKKEVSKHLSGKKKLSPSSSKKGKSIENIINQLAENLEPSVPKKKKSKTKLEPVSSENDETSSSSMKEDHEEAPIVLTFKSSDITNISPPKKKEQKSHTFDKTSTKLSKKSELKKSKKQNKKKAKKLIVSFKNNQSFQPKKKKALEKEGVVESPVESPIPSSLDTSSDTSKQDPVSPEKSPPPIFLDPVPEPLLDVTPPDEDEEVKHKKKSKKKSKTKLKKHQKIVNVETFTVADQTVVKVKKKKIYKNRNGEKVLIRLIKNHCNKNGDIVKTETIVVDNDNPPVDDEKEKVTPTPPETPKSLGFPPSTKTPLNTAFKELESKKTPEKTIAEKVPEKVNHEKPSATKEVNKEKKVVEKKGSEKKGEKKSVEKKVTEKKHVEKSIPEKSVHDEFLDKKIKENSPEYSPHLDNVLPNHSAAKRKSKFKHSSDSKSNFKSSEKRPIFKKTQKIMKKPLSRPANKNVTVGGKVVGKTTKGMKKTGGDNIEPPPVNKAIVKSNVFEPIPPEIPTVPVTEPKNVYNFFCRKYRPIVVQQFPKADFSEISRRLAALWKTLSETERQDQRDKFEELHSVSQQKLAKLGRLSPTMWSESDLKFIKKNISENDSYAEVFTIPKYPVKRLSPIDMAAHLSLLGDSLNVISGALQQQSSMTVHGAMSVLLDSILSALAPLIFFTSHIPEMKSIDDAQQARILDNLAYILPGL